MKKKKTGLSILMVVVSLLLICASVVMVYSAGSHTVKGSLNVTYQAVDVGATVSAKFQVAGSNSVTSMTTTGSAGGATSLTFNISDATPTGSLSWDSAIRLDDDATYVLFTYSFTNNATSGADPFYVSLDNSMTGSDFTVYYYNTGDSTFEADTLANKYTAITTGNKTSPTALGTNGKVTVTADSTAYIYILIVIKTASMASDATFNSNNGNVSFLIKHSST